MGNIFLVVIKEVDVRGFLFPFKIKAVKSILKFQIYIQHQRFLIRTNCKALKETLKKDVKTLFDFDIEHIKEESHSLPYFLTIKCIFGKASNNAIFHR